jgi:hypothetical protein
MARDYSKGKVYMIRSKDEDCVPYVGSTTKQYLSQRIEKHHSNYKNWKKNGKGFMSSFTLFEKYEFKNCYIELLELCPCKSIEELLKKEREWFDKLNCVNIVKPFISKEEMVEYFKIYQQEHKEQIAEKAKIYQQEHKEQIAEKMKEKYECPCGSICRKSDKARHERSLKHQDYLSTIGTLCSTTVTETS